MTFVQATFVLMTSVHIRNMSVVTDQIMTNLGQDKVKARSGQVNNNVKARSRRGLGKVKARSRQGRDIRSMSG